jgi:hypothetical protein
MNKKDVFMPTALAWLMVNYQTENGFKMNEKANNFGDIKIHQDIFDPLFRNEKIKINYSFTSMHLVLYEFLRPEIITQHPRILKCTSPEDAENKLGKELKISTDLKYPYHQEW